MNTKIEDGLKNISELLLLLKYAEARTEMNGKIYDILICSKTDVKHFVQIQKYLENSAKRKTMNALAVETIKTISTIVSSMYSLHHPESEYWEMIIDTLSSAVRNKDNEFGRIESERGNLTLEILQCIEHDAKFHILLCKLLSLINLMCSHSINVWQLLARPVLNIFINKKFEHVHMEKALREFINISKNPKLSELVRVIKKNRDIPKLLSMLVRGYGDFIVQMNVLELLVSLKGYDKSLVKTVFRCWNSETSELLDYLTFSNFKKDSRIFLNAFNKSLGLGRKVFSLNCSVFYFGNSKLSPLPSVEGIWIDLNQDSKRMCIFCTVLQLNPNADHSDILQIPVKEVERIKLKFYTISGEDCYCIYMRIRNTSEIDHFRESSGVICKALVSVNQRREVVDFVKAMEEISDKILWYRKMKTNEIPSSGDSLSQNSRMGPLESPLGEPKNHSFNILATSPLPSGSKQKNDNKQSLSLSQTSCTSSIFSLEKELGSEEKCGGDSSMKTWRNQFEEKGNNLDKVLGDQNLQASQISSSVLESQILTLDSGLNSSVSSHTSAVKEVKPDKWVFSNNIQLDLSRSEVGIRIGLLSENQDASGTSNYKNMMIGSNNNNTKNYEESNQIKRSYSRRMYEEWANSVDDAISADELRIRESNKENISETLNVSVLPGKKCDIKTRKINPTQQNKKINGKEREKKNEILRTSLLDPNGYCYKRWKSQTTSERSNFWLNKLKETETKTKTSQPVKDIFHFSEEEDDYEGSNASKAKTQTAKKVCVSKDREKNEIQKPGFQMKGDKIQNSCYRKPPIEECICHHEVIANRESQGGRTLPKTPPGIGRISVTDGFAEKQGYHFEVFRNNLFLKFSSRYDGLLLTQTSDARPKNDEKIRTEENISREKESADGERFLSSTNKRKDSREMNEVCELKMKYLKSEKVCPGSLRKQENAKRKNLRCI